MLHLDDELIAAAAIGERLAEGYSAHLTECAECAGLLRETEGLIARAQAVGRPQPLLVPPAHVWDAIVTEIESDDAVVTPPLGGVEAPHVEDERGGALATVTPIRRFALWRMAATAAVGVVIGGAGVGLWASRGADDFTVVASAALTNLSNDAPAGTARVEDRPDGARLLVLDTDYSSVQGGDLGVWLIDPNITGMVSLGFLTSSHGEFVIPQGYSTSAYPIVDISIEPRDGVATHSGDSITRGTLGA